MKAISTCFSSIAGYLAIACCLFVATGCELMDLVKPEANYLNDPSEGYKLWKDLYFSKQKDITLDLYQPLTQTDNPAEVVILLHGGGWTSGDKVFLKPTLDALTKSRKNLAIANVNYRVSGDAHGLLPLQLEDIQSAIQFLRTHAATYKLRTDNYRMAGFSAGGHIALTHAYLSKETCISTVIGFSAPTELCMKELMTSGLWPRVEKLTGRKYTDSIDVFKRASPFHLASGRSPRTMLIYGVNDTLVSPIHGELLSRKLKLLRVPTTFKVYAGEDHEITPHKAASCILDSYN